MRTFVGLTIAALASPVIAYLPLQHNLAVQCHKAALKLEAIRDKQSDFICKEKLDGTNFEIAGASITSGDKDTALAALKMKLEELNYSKKQGCKEQPTIDWAIKEANFIKRAIS